MPKAQGERRATELLEDMEHQIQIRGPEGDQVRTDADGKVVEGEGTVTFEGLRKYETKLRARAGLPEAVPAKQTQSSGVEALSTLAKLLGQKGV